MTRSMSLPGDGMPPVMRYTERYAKNVLHIKEWTIR